MNNISSIKNFPPVKAGVSAAFNPPEREIPLSSVQNIPDAGAVLTPACPAGPQQDISRVLREIRNPDSVSRSVQATSLGEFAGAPTDFAVNGLTPDSDGVIRTSDGTPYIRSQGRILRVKWERSDGLIEAIDPNTGIKGLLVRVGMTDEWGRPDLEGGGRIRMLPGADPATFKAVRGFAGIIDLGKNKFRTASYEFDVELNAFTLRGEGSNYYVPSPTSFGLVKAKELSPVTDAQRLGAIRALGINISEWPPIIPPRAADASAIPQVIRSIWVGDREIPNSLLKNMQKNAKRVTSKASSSYSYELYLSKESPEAFKKNFGKIKSLAPGVKVVELEETLFYKGFAKSKYFRQYQAAKGQPHGGQTHFAAACDVLRYRLIHAEGGLYMDMDDTLLAPLDTLMLAKNELMVGHPVGCGALGLYYDFNNSIFGSLPGNETLDAMSEESYRRFEQAGTKVYSNRPPSGSNIYPYMREVSRINGPRLFTDILMERSDLGVFRELYKIVKSPISLDEKTKKSIEKGLSERFPLLKKWEIGHANSWLQD